MRRLLTILLLTLVASAGLTAPADAAYALNQYRQPDASVCVQISTSRTWLYNKVWDAANQWSTKTDANMYLRSSCTGNKVTVRAGYYGHNGKRAWTLLWISGSTIVRADTYINLSYDATGRAGTYAIRHEFGHVLLGTKHSSSCYSLMYPNWSSGCGVYWLTRDAINAVNWAY